MFTLQNESSWLHAPLHGFPNLQDEFTGPTWMSGQASCSRIVEMLVLFGGMWMWPLNRRWNQRFGSVCLEVLFVLCRLWVYYSNNDILTPAAEQISLNRATTCSNQPVSPQQKSLSTLFPIDS